MEKLDILAMKSGLEIRQMMELAGWHMVSVFHELSIPKNKKIVVVCGTGNKAGDGLTAARHLLNHGYLVTVILISHRLKADPKHQLSLLLKMKMPILLYSSNKKKAVAIIKKADVIIDALIGYNLHGSPRGSFGELIVRINESKAKVISYDLTSGMDPTTGECHNPCINASATLTLALPKRGFTTKEGKQVSGIIFLGDIGIPAFLYDKIKKGIRPQFEKAKNSLIVV